MSLRITAGARRGFSLFSLPGKATRPMGERARQAVFNLLGNRVGGAVVLDLFAGSGALSLEALSRGAASAVLVENSPAAVDVIGRNIDKLEFGDHARLLRSDAFRIGGSHLRGFDLIFCDPPYEMVGSVTPDSTFGQFLASLLERDILKSTGIVVLGHHKESEIVGPLGNLCLSDRRNYGTNGVSFFTVCAPS